MDNYNLFSGSKEFYIDPYTSWNPTKEDPEVRQKMWRFFNCNFKFSEKSF